MRSLLPSRSEDDVVRNGVTYSPMRVREFLPNDDASTNIMFGEMLSVCQGGIGDRGAAGHWRLRSKEERERQGASRSASILDMNIANTLQQRWSIEAGGLCREVRRDDEARM
jgi:hypothetical protein